MSDLKDTEEAGARHLAAVTSYYGKRESRIGYAVVLGGTRHFGYYEPGLAAWHFGTAMRRMEDLLGARLALPGGSKVLDAGAGVGDVASRLAQTWGLDVTGVDIIPFNVAEAARRVASRHLSDQVRVVQMDYAQLGFPDASFDGAYTMETLVHSDRVEQVLAELHRVLRPGGRLVHLEYSRLPAGDTSAEEERVLSEVNDVAAMPAFQRFEHGVLEQLLAEAGFINVEADDITDRMMPMLQVFATLAWPFYTALRLMGQPTRWINAMAAVELYRHRHAWRYKVYSCSKP